MNKIIKKITFVVLTSMLGFSAIPLCADPAATTAAIFARKAVAVAPAVASTSIPAAIGIGLGSAVVGALIGFAVPIIQFKISPPKFTGPHNQGRIIYPFLGAAIGSIASSIPAYFLAGGGQAGLVASGAALVPLAICAALLVKGPPRT